ncbi:hypothetical protein CJP74_02045 [Psittacicella melopsittaci]|uniref:TNase-like domain-containing protein n=1 Tax=Psittacicella melopsittaci TaxID=2028576 RepID=A0A3A1Y523_9GAMM|nr:thermonuclease family protein [Psittacicella melopsittaci]RIY33392.1 hypothetical protein CJP74_02045 [Psittacicella melopsittaci]
MSDYKQTPQREDNAAQERWRRNRRKLFLFPLLFLIFAGVVYYYDQQQLQAPTSDAAVKQPMLAQEPEQAPPEVQIQEQDFSQVPRIEIPGLGNVGYQTQYIAIVPNINFAQTLPACTNVQVQTASSFTCLFAGNKRITVNLLGLYAPALTNAQGQEATYGKQAQEQLKKIISLGGDNSTVYLQIHQADNQAYQATAYNVLGANIAYTMLFNGYAFVDLKVNIQQYWGEQYALAAIDAQNNRLGMWEQKNWINALPPVDPQQ